MAMTDKAWSADASQYKDTDAYCAACLIDMNEPGRDKVQGLCKLPIQEPDGTVNSNAVYAAAAALAGARGGVKASPDAKKSAAKKLVSLYKQMKMDAPPSIQNMAK